MELAIFLGSAVGIGLFWLAALFSFERRRADRHRPIGLIASLAWGLAGCALFGLSCLLTRLTQVYFYYEDFSRLELVAYVAVWLVPTALFLGCRSPKA
jgi:hypothetical protein